MQFCPVHIENPEISLFGVIFPSEDRTFKTDSDALEKKYEPLAAARYRSLISAGIEAFKNAPEDQPEEGFPLAARAMRAKSRAIFGPLYTSFYTEAIEKLAEASFQALGGYAERARKPWERAAARFIRRWANRAIAGITNSSIRWFKRIVTKGTDKGVGTARLARELDRESKDFSRYRATMWVKTELVAASNYASITGARETGLDLIKYWITSIDGRERPAHHEANLQERPLDEDFLVGGEKADVPGDPRLSLKNRIRCRCAVGYKPA